MRLHARELRCQQATNDLRTAILDVQKKYDLTEGEALQAVSLTLGGWVSNMAKYLIREERHPGEPNKPGGLE